MSNTRQPNLFKFKSDSIADQARTQFNDEAPTEMKIKK